MLHLKQVETPQEIEAIRDLLTEYQRVIGTDLCFQGFAAELAGLPGAYAPPAGRLLLGQVDGSIIGCVALQRVDAARGEMKRLYVRSSARGLGIGRALVQRILEDARSIGYTELVLDTLPAMIEAQRSTNSSAFATSHLIAPIRSLDRVISDASSSCLASAGSIARLRHDRLHRRSEPVREF